LGGKKRAAHDGRYGGGGNGGGGTLYQKRLVTDEMGEKVVRASCGLSWGTQVKKGVEQTDFGRRIVEPNNFTEDSGKGRKITAGLGEKKKGGEKKRSLGGKWQLCHGNEPTKKNCPEKMKKWDRGKHPGGGGGQKTKKRQKQGRG